MNPRTVAEIAAGLGARLVGRGDVVIDRLDSIGHGDERTLTFVRDEINARQWLESPIPAALAGEALAESIEARLDDAPERALLVVPDADLAMIALLEAAAPDPYEPPPGVDPAAHVDESATVEPGVRIGPGAVVGPRSTIGAGAILHAGAVVGAEVTIGAQSVLFPNVTIRDRCSIGRGVILHPGVVIGADGFGYRPAPDGRGIVKIPHIGTVEIGDGVEIGANSAVDRGKFGPTVVGDGTKIDNLVQVGHNVRIGRCCIICGCCALAGSVELGDGVTLAGKVSVVDQIKVGAGATLGAESSVMNDVPPGATWLGRPAVPERRFREQLVAIRRLPEAMRGLRKLMRDAGVEPTGGRGKDG